MANSDRSREDRCTGVAEFDEVLQDGPAVSHTRSTTYRSRGNGPRFRDLAHGSRFLQASLIASRSAAAWRSLLARVTAWISLACRRIGLGSHSAQHSQPAESL